MSGLPAAWVVLARLPTPIGLLILLAAGACAPADRPDDDLGGSLTVLAASSLAEALDDVGTAFREEHPDVEIRITTGGSQRLATQIVEGAEADVFASADIRQVERVVDAGLAAGDAAVFATNRLALVVEPGNPAGIRDPADLERADLRVVLPAEEVPAGRYAREALRRAGVEVEPASLEADVRAVLARVALGEADAGIVYLTDAQAAGDRVDGLPLPSGMDVRASYPVVRLAASPNPEAASAFIDLLTSEAGADLLRRHGFGPPDPPAADPDARTGVPDGRGTP